MKTYKDIISEVAEPKGEDEKSFKSKHIIQKIDHPAAEEGQFTGGKTAKKDKSKLAGYKDGEDKEVYEAHKTDMQERYGDKWKSVMYANATKKSMEESVSDLEEVNASKIIKDLGAGDSVDVVVQKNLNNKTTKDEILKIIRAHQWKTKMKRESVEVLDEAFKAGDIKLADGSSAKLTNEQAISLNTLFKELTTVNQKKMQERMLKDKKGFSEIVSFAKEAL